MNTITIGVDLSKNTFAICEVDGRTCVLRRKEFGRQAFAAYLAQLPPGTVVAMEACSGAHHWGRRCQQAGLQPRLIAAKFVQPFRKSQSSKNDRNDAEAIATAALQGNMRFVPVKTIEQQVRLSWHRAREGFKADALALANRMRSLLAELGVTIPRTAAALRQSLANLSELDLPAEFIGLLQTLSAQWRTLHEQIESFDRHIAAHAKADPRCTRVLAMTGVGTLSADAIVASVANAREFRNGRQFAAWLGLAPSQHSSGGKQRLGRTCCTGDSYLRTLLIQGARSAELRARAVAIDKATPEQLWIISLQRLPFGKRMVAIANKHARQIWTMLAREVDYDPHAASKHPMAQRRPHPSTAATP